MKELSKRGRQARTLRAFRKIHRLTGALLFVVFLFVSITGLLLGWKKHSGGLILADTRKGSSTNLKDWRPLDELSEAAVKSLRENVSPEISAEIDRIDVRADKGTVKFSFKNHYWGIQLDGATGETLSVERRNSDFIEHIHDGSILDDLFNTSDGQIKLLYTTISGLALLLFTVTGFWLWYGPKRMKNAFEEERKS